MLDGRYRIGRLLGRGGMAEVYAARDERLERDVAIKIFPPDGEPGWEVERTRAESQALAPLDHPNIVALYDAGCVGGRHYLALQLVDGATLAARIAAGDLTRTDVAKIGQGAAAALAYLHARGIVHRDVKPGNILVGTDGDAYLSDFGTARHANSPHLTATGETIGTASYLSPEQVRGFGVGPATDVYALGLVLLECLTGRREYEGTPAEAAISRLTRRPAIDATLPDGWREMLRRMTDDDPARRPAASVVAAFFAAQADLVAPSARAVNDDDVARTAVLATATAGAVLARRRRIPWVSRAMWVRGAVGVVVVSAVALAAAVLPGAAHASHGASHPTAPARTPIARTSAATTSAATTTAAPDPTPSPTVQQVARVTDTSKAKAPAHHAPAPPPAHPAPPAHGHGPGHH